MTNRGYFFLVIGALLTGVGLLALAFPVFINSWDQFGWQINCGTGYNTDLDQASIAAPVIGVDAVNQCESALTERRMWVIPIVVVGWVALTVLLIAFLRHASSIELHKDEADEPAHKDEPAREGAEG